MVLSASSERCVERKETVRDLLTRIEEEFGTDVEETLVDDATPGTWESVAIAVYVSSASTTVYENYTERAAAHIDVNLQSFAPRLYNLIRETPGVTLGEVVSRPERCTTPHREDVYTENLYLIDIWVR